MAIERRMSRQMFQPGEVVELRQMCFTPGRLFEPGKYLVGDLPDLAFEMGLVDRLPCGVKMQKLPLKMKIQRLKGSTIP